MSEKDVIAEAMTSGDVSKKLDTLLYTSAKTGERVEQLDKRTDRMEEAIIALTKNADRVQRLAEDVQTVRSGQAEIWTEVEKVTCKLDAHEKETRDSILYVEAMKEKKAIELLDFTAELRTKDPMPLLDKGKDMLSKIDRVTVAVIIFLVLGVVGFFYNTKAPAPQPTTVVQGLSQETLDKALKSALKDIQAQHDHQLLEDAKMRRESTSDYPR